MELWRVESDRTERPKVLGARNFGVALALHVGFFALFWLYSVFHGLFDRKEEIVPIDLTVVVNQNLEGNDDEPPPLKNPDPPEPPQPKPKPKPVVKEPEKPKELEQIVTNITAKVDKKEEKKPEKPKEEEKPEEPKKTKEQLRKERIERMRQSSKVVNKRVEIEVRNAPSGNGRTDRKTLSNAEIQKLLNMGYKPGTSNQLAANEEQLGFSLVKAAFEAKWDEPPWTDTLKPMVIRVWFGNGGRVLRYNLEQSSGDARADQSIKSAASRVGSIPALPAAFIDKYRSSGVPCRFTVRPK